MANKVLAQMKTLTRGIFIVSANLSDHLDEASIRRFDDMIYYDYKKPNKCYISSKISV